MNAKFFESLNWAMPENSLGEVEDSKSSPEINERDLIRCILLMPKEYWQAAAAITVWIFIVDAAMAVYTVTAEAGATSSRIRLRI